MISGALIAFVVLKYGVIDFREKLINTNISGLQTGKLFDWTMQYLIPIQVIVLLGWWMYRSIFEFAPETWFDPTDPYSIMTCLVQWGLVAGILIAFNKKIVALTRG